MVPYYYRSWNLGLLKKAFFIPQLYLAILCEQMKWYINYKKYKTRFGDMVSYSMRITLDINFVVIT